MITCTDQSDNDICIKNDSTVEDEDLGVLFGLGR